MSNTGPVFTLCSAPAKKYEPYTTDEALKAPTTTKGRIALSIRDSWGPGPTFKVKFIDFPKPDEELRRKIVWYMNRWNKYGDVLFSENAVRPQDSELKVDGQYVFGEVRITLKGNEYWSLLGTQILDVPNDEPTMSLGGFCLETPDSEYSRVVIHETGHTLGFVHEHLRQEIVDTLDIYKTIDYYQKTERWTAKETYHQVLTAEVPEDIYPSGPEPDIASIMCYHIPAECTKNHIAIIGGSRLSEHDKKFVRDLYGEPGRRIPQVPLVPDSESDAEESDETVKQSGESNNSSVDKYQDLPLKFRMRLNAANNPNSSKNRQTGTQSASEKVTSMLFEYLLDNLTKGGGDCPPMIDPEVSFVQFAKQGMPIDPDQLKDLVSSTNKGNLKQSKYFSGLVNNKDNRDIETIYGDFLKSATAIEEVDWPEKEKLFKEARKYLAQDVLARNSDGTIAKDEKGKPLIAEIVDSPLYTAYKKRRTKFNECNIAYNTALNGVDFKNSEAQFKWEYEDGPKLKLARDEALEDWRSNANLVESALNVLQSMGESLPNVVISNSKTMFNVAKTVDGRRISFPEPANFVDEKYFAEMVLNSASDYQTERGTSSGWNTSLEFSGLFTVDSSGKTVEQESKNQASRITLKLKTAVVRIDRPWMNEMLFKISGWKVSGEKMGCVSDGKRAGNLGLLPNYPTHFIVAKDLVIEADWSEEETKFMSDTVKAGGSVGWGPFKISGGYETGTESKQLQSGKDGQKLSIPGMQIIGWINTIVPHCPLAQITEKENDPKKNTGSKGKKKISQVFPAIGGEKARGRITPCIQPRHHVASNGTVSV